MSSLLSFRGTVVRGDGRGRVLGFPTANLEQIQGKIPEPGIYACWSKLTTQRKWLPAVVHSGPRPAVGDPKPVVEVHLLDFPDRDLYQEILECRDLIFLRAIQNFASLEDLTAAIAADCEKARTILNSSSQPDPN